MAGNVKPIPEGCNGVIPHLVVRGGARAIEFYKQAFGAEEVCRMPGPDGEALMHAELKVGGGFIFLADEFPGMSRSPNSLGGSSVTLHLCVEDVDAVYARALAAGAESRMPPADMFWGDRYCKVTDPFGHEWGLATHIEDIAPDEMERRAAAAFATHDPAAQDACA